MSNQETIQPKESQVWNSLDDWGLAFGIERLPAEENKEFRERLYKVAGAHGNASLQGIVDGISASLGLESWKTSGKKHFYLRFTPVERDDDSNTFPITVTIDGVPQTQLIEYLEPPRDWMAGSYMYTAPAGFIVWRDDEGYYTRHLEFLEAPKTGTDITVTYYTRTESDEIVKVVETEAENKDIIPEGVELPADNQIKVDILSDFDFQSRHMAMNNMISNDLMSYVDEVNSPYPFQWGTFEWDNFRWEVGGDTSVIPSYFDCVSASGDLTSGTGYGNDLKVVGIDDFTQQPHIMPGFVYYRDREYYFYNSLQMQDIPSGDISIVLSGSINASGAYGPPIDPAPVVCTAGLSTEGLIIGHPSHYIDGDSQTFNASGEYIFGLDSIPSDMSTIRAQRTTPGSGGELDTTKPEPAAYFPWNNSVIIRSPLTAGQTLKVTWATEKTRLFLNDVLDGAVGGYNLAMNYRYDHRIPSESLTTLDTVVNPGDGSLGWPASGAHHHTVIFSNTKLLRGRLLPTILVTEDEYDQIFDYADEEFTSGLMSEYMALGGFDHEHKITDGGYISYEVVALPDGTELQHTHTIVVPGDYGWYDPTPNKLRRRSDLTTIDLGTKAAETYLGHIKDQANAIPRVEADYFTTYPTSGGLQVSFDKEIIEGTIQYEGAEEATPIPVPPNHCPPIDESAVGKILAIGGTLAATRLDLYPSTSAVASGDFALTIRATDYESGGVPDAQVTLSCPTNSSGNYWVMDSDDGSPIEGENVPKTNTAGLLHRRLVLNPSDPAITKGEILPIKATAISRTPYEIRPLPSGINETGTTLNEAENITYYIYEVSKTIPIYYVGD